MVGQSTYTELMQTATGNLINDRAWAAEPIPGLESRRWTGYIEVKDTDVAGKWYAVSLPNTGRSDELREPDRVMVLPTGFKVNHFAVSPHVPVLVGTSVNFSLRNPAFVDNELTTTIVNQTPYLNVLRLRTTLAPTILPSSPYLAHQVWIRLANAPRWNGRLIVSVGGMRTAPVFDFFKPGDQEPGALIWGERRNGTIGLIPGSEGFGDDGIRPGGRDFPEAIFFSVSPGVADLNPSQAVTLYASSPATWTLVGGGTLSAATGSTITYTAPGGVGSATITAVSVEDPTSTAIVPITISVPTVTAVTLIADQATLLVGGTAGVAASVAGTGIFNPNITYSITGPGTLSGAGLSRTLVATGTGSIVVTATSVGDPSKSASVTVTTSAPVAGVTSITLVSTIYSITTLQTANLLATVTAVNGGSTAVTYSFTGPASLGGSGLTRTLTPTGPGQITVTATSVQDSTKTASVSISVTQGNLVSTVTLTGSPTTGSPFAIVNLTATVTGAGTYSPVVTLELVSGPGAVATGASFGAITNGTLTYGATPTTGTTVVRARSVADPSKFADLTVPLAVDSLVTGVVVTPQTSMTVPGNTFTATAVVNPSGRPQNVTWTVTSGPATLSLNAGLPTFAVTGTGSIVITATSVANPAISGSATITSATTVTVASVRAYRVTNSGGATEDLNPAAVPGGTTTYASAAVAGTGTFSPNVTWSVISGGGTVTPQAGNVVLFTTPGSTTAGQFGVIRATSVGDTTKFADVTIGYDTTVAVTGVQWSVPGPVTSFYYADDPTATGSVAGLSVSVFGTGAYNKAVTFTGQSAQYVTGGTLAGNVTPVSVDGLPQTPPFFSNPPGTYSLRAASTGDTTKSASLIVNRVLKLRNVAVTAIYTDAFGNSITPATTPPVSQMGTLLYGDASLQALEAYVNPINANVTWSVTGPATFTATGTANRTITISPTGPGTIVATARSVYDPTKTASLTYTVLAPVTINTIVPYRVDTQAVNATVYSGTPTDSDTQAVLYNANVSGVGIPNAFGDERVSWSIVSGPGSIIDPSLLSPARTFPPFTIGFSVILQTGLTSATTVLRARSFADPSKFTDIAIPILPNPVNNVTAITITDNLGQTSPATTFFEPGSGSAGANTRRTYKVVSTTFGSSSPAASGTTTAIVSGGSIATLTPIASSPASRKEHLLVRNSGQSGWVKVRATSVADPSKYREQVYYFRPVVLSIMALTHFRASYDPTAAPTVKDNVVRFCWPGLSEPITVTGTNCSLVGPPIEPPTTWPERDSTGRALAVNVQLAATGPYSLTVALVSNPAITQTITFGRDSSGYLVGNVSTLFDDSQTLQYYSGYNLTTGVSDPAFRPTSYSIAPVAPAAPALTNTI